MNYVYDYKLLSQDGSSQQRKKLERQTRARNCGRNKGEGEEAVKKEDEGEEEKNEGAWR
jgi:hypothetical protein